MNRIGRAASTSLRPGYHKIAKASCESFWPDGPGLPTAWTWQRPGLAYNLDLPTAWTCPRPGLAYGHPFLPSLPWFFLSFFIVHLFLSSLPWFFLSLSIVQAFLPRSPALAFQALPLAHRSSLLDLRHPIQTIQSCPPTPPGARGPNL